MWDNLLNSLKGKKKPPQKLPEPDEQLALGALLVRVAKSDREYHVAEITEIDRILAKSFQLNAIDSAKLRALSEKLEAQAPGTAEFAEIIRDTVGYGHRLEVVNALWQVIMADGQDTPEEDATLHDIEHHLGIDPADSPAP